MAKAKEYLYFVVNICDDDTLLLRNKEQLQTYLEDMAWDKEFFDELEVYRIEKDSVKKPTLEMKVDIDA